ncbi:MAG: PASTA domain-containing protein [Bacteroidaceae bacterium]|nr:PASTA domain-containing protein [Bacteroidaceae bacterium]MBR3757678.1 PASTA domain-containing protein [Bacteroidaceae bacterium]
MTIKEFFSIKKNFFFWGNLLAMAIVAVGLVWGVFKWLDHYTDHDVAVTVPEVIGLQWDEAEALLRKHTLTPVVSDSTYNPSKPGGIILDMTPAQGSVVKEGRSVYLTVNTNRPPMRVIPDLIDNSSLREAEAKLKAMGFVLAENDTIEGEQDWIYGIKYKGASLKNGDEVPLGATLVLEVGGGEYMFMEEMMGDSLSGGSRNFQSEEATVVDDSWFE